MPEENQSPEVGAALRWLRTQAGLQQRELSERMSESGRGVSTVWLSQVENGRRQPSAALVARMLQALDVSHLELDDVCRRRPWRVAAPAEQLIPGGKDVATLAQELGELNALYASLDSIGRREVIDYARSKISRGFQG